MEAIRRSRRWLKEDMVESALWGQHASAIPDAEHVIYRVLSERAHPTGAIAAFYIPDQGDGSVLRSHRFHSPGAGVTDADHLHLRESWPYLHRNGRATSPFNIAITGR